MAIHSRPARGRGAHPRGVLFLCTGNSARSQMAEALLRRHAGAHFVVYSAGIRPRGLHPLTTVVMAEAGLDVSHQRSKGLDEIQETDSIFFVISLCENAERECPETFAPASIRLSWPFPDPAIPGSPEQMLARFRKVRDDIDARIQEWLRKEVPGSWLS